MVERADMDASFPKAAMNGTAGAHSYYPKDRIKAFKELDDERLQLLKVLLESNDALKLENEALRHEIATLRLAASQSRDDGLEQCQLQLRSTELQLRAAHRSMETSPFVLVLVDGNAHTFHDILFRHGALGGADAAIKLREAIEQQVVCSNNPDWKIVVRIYIDFQGFVKEFAKLRDPISETGLRNFVGGFTQVQPLCDIIDTGPGREEALVKIKEQCSIFLENVQCKHIFYGCALNDTSLATLEAYKYDPIIASSITLIKSQAPEDTNIHIAFELVELPSVFRSLNDVEDSDNGAGQSDHGINEQSSAVAEWARFAPDRARTRHTNGQRELNEFPGSNWDSPKRMILLNIHNQRVDPPRPHFDPKSFDIFMAKYKNKKLCHFHYLLGSCYLSKCSYSHQPQVTPQELDILRFCTRRLQCSELTMCRKINCIYGHICPYEKAGFCNKGRECLFKAVHDVDRTAVRVWNRDDDDLPFVNGSTHVPLSQLWDDRKGASAEKAEEEGEEEEEEEAETVARIPTGIPPRHIRSPFPWEKPNGTSEGFQSKQPAIEVLSPHAPPQPDPTDTVQEEKAELTYKHYFSKK